MEKGLAAAQLRPIAPRLEGGEKEQGTAAPLTIASTLNRGAAVTPIISVKMGTLTGTGHGDAANDLMGFYIEKTQELEDSGQYFMAALALGFALETAVLAYLLVEFMEDNGDDLEIPDTVDFWELLDAANEIDVLNAPIDIPARVGGKGRPKHVAKDVVDDIRKFRNLIHPAVALRQSYDPRTFTREQLQDFKEMFRSVAHSLVYYL